MIARAVVVLPHPDSPASARTSPLRDLEVHAVDGARLRRLLPAQPGAEPDAPGEVHVQVRTSMTDPRRPRTTGGLGAHVARLRRWRLGRLLRPAGRRRAGRRRASSSCGSVSSQSSNTTGHRGWNVHPSGRSLGVGRVAAETRGLPAEPLVADLRERGRERLGVRVLRLVEDLSAGPSSTMRPAYMIARRSETSTSTERSWVMKIIDRPSSFWSSFMQPEHLRLDHDVERGRGLVGDDDGRAAGERHRDHHALLLAAGELVRVVLHAAGGQADLLQQRADADLRLALVRLAVHDDRPRRSGRRSAAPGSARASLPGRRSRPRPSGPRAAAPASS